VEGCGGRRPCHRWPAAITRSGLGNSRGKIEGGGGTTINCHKPRVKDGREGERSGAGTAGAAATRGRAKERKERGGRREREAPTGGALVSVAEGKRKMTA
jgi:hypothetical protein